MGTNHERRNRACLHEPVRLAGLRGADAEWLIGQARSEFAKHGMAVTDALDGSLTGPDGQVFGLDTLSVIVSREPRAQWEQIVAGYCATMAGVTPDLRPGDLEEFKRQLHPRVVAAAYFPHPIPAYAKDLGAGLWQIAALQGDGIVALLLADDDLDRLGGWEGAEPIALANLRQRRVSHHVVIAEPGQVDSAIHSFGAGHKFVAARFAIIDELMGQAGVSTEGAPLLVAMPERERLLVHVPVGEGIYAAGLRMSEITEHDFSSSPARLSPLLYFRAADGAWESVPVRAMAGGSRALWPEGALLKWLWSLKVRNRPWYGG